MKRCSRCGRILLFSPKMHKGVGRGVGLVDGKTVHFCAECSWAQFDEIFRTGGLKEHEPEHNNKPQL